VITVQEMDKRNFDHAVLEATGLLTYAAGLDPTTEHGRGTSARFVKMMMELTTPEEFNFTTFDNTEHVDEMIIIQNIPFYTLCNHHVIPFFGEAHIAYIPDKDIAGLSKFARTVKYFAKGLWVQEHLTTEIADYLEEKLEPLGIAIVMKAEHLCMTMRGVQTPGALTTTSAMRGVFLDPTKGARNEFLTLIKD